MLFRISNSSLSMSKMSAILYLTSETAMPYHKPLGKTQIQFHVIIFFLMCDYVSNMWLQYVITQSWNWHWVNNMTNHVKINVKFGGKKKQKNKRKRFSVRVLIMGKLKKQLLLTLFMWVHLICETRMPIQWIIVLLAFIENGKFPLYNFCENCLFHSCYAWAVKK